MGLTSIKPISGKASKEVWQGFGRILGGSSIVIGAIMLLAKSHIGLALVEGGLLTYGTLTVLQKTKRKAKALVAFLALSTIACLGTGITSHILGHHSWSNLSDLNCGLIVTGIMTGAWLPYAVHIVRQRPPEEDIKETDIETDDWKLP